MQLLLVEIYYPVLKPEKLFMARLFSFIPTTIRNDCIVHFIDLHDDISLFEQFELVSREYFWSGSVIPVLNAKIKQLEDLFNRINQPRFIRHRILVNKEIEYFKKLIKKAEIEELLEDY